MRIKIKDLELAIEYIKKNFSESADMEFDTDEKGLHVLNLGFTDSAKKVAKIVLYDANNNVTPELVSKAKLYKP